MNIVVVSTGFDTKSIADRVCPMTTILSDNADKLLALSDIDLALDELIYMNRSPVDWVLHEIGRAHV